MDDIALTTRWVADDRSAKQAAWALTRGVLLRPAFISMAVLVWLLAGLLAALELALGNGVGWPVLFALFPPIVLPIMFLSCIRRLRITLAPGSEWAAGFASDSYRVVSSFVDATLRYDTFRAVRIIGDWVLLQPDGTRQWALYPGPLFPPDELDRMRHAIESARRAAQ